MNKVKILLVCPNKQPIIKEINNNISEFYGLVYYPYYEIRLEENVFLICSKEGKGNGFPLCRIYKNKKIYSNFVILAKKSNKYVSLKQEQINFYTQIFSI